MFKKGWVADATICILILIYLGTCWMATASHPGFEWLSDLFNDLKITDVLLAVFTGVLAFYTFRLWKSTEKLWKAGERQIKVAEVSAESAKDSAQVAKSTLIATNRPWIAIKSVTATGPLIFDPMPDDPEGRVDLTVVLKNVGKSAAVRIQVNIRLTISNTVDLRTEQKIFADALCAARKKAELHPNIIQPEITLFPDEEMAITTTAWMNQEPLAEFRQWAGKIPGAIVFPALVGAVHYEFTFERGHHQTGIIYGLHKATPYPTDRKPPFYSVVPLDFHVQNEPGAVHIEGFIDRDDLVIVQNIVGTGPID